MRGRVTASGMESGLKVEVGDRRGLEGQSSSFIRDLLSLGTEVPRQILRSCPRFTGTQAGVWPFKILS